MACPWTVTWNSPFLVQVSVLWCWTMPPPPWFWRFRQIRGRVQGTRQGDGTVCSWWNRNHAHGLKLLTYAHISFMEKKACSSVWRHGWQFPNKGDTMAIFLQSEADGNFPSEICRQQLCPWRGKAQQLRCSQQFLLYRRHIQQFCPMRELANNFSHRE